jgi:hypothetical protein
VPVFKEQDAMSGQQGSQKEWEVVEGRKGQSNAELFFKRATGIATWRAEKNVLAALEKQRRERREAAILHALLVVASAIVGAAVYKLVFVLH